jgi:hypothetical protein
MLLSSMRFLAPIFAGLALAYAGPCGAQEVDQKPSAAAPAQIVPEEVIPPPGTPGGDPGLRPK